MNKELPITRGSFFRRFLPQTADNSGSSRGDSPSLLTRNASRRTVLKNTGIFLGGALAGTFGSLAIRDALSYAPDKTPQKKEAQKETLNPAETALWNLTHYTENGVEKEITLDWLRTNPKDTTNMVDIRDANGDVTTKYTVCKIPTPKRDRFSCFVSRSRVDQTGKFTGYKTVSAQIPLENVGAIAVSPDERRFVIAGEKIYRSAQTGVVNEKDGGTWQEISWPYGNSGVTFDLQWVTKDPELGDVFFGNNGNYEGGVGQYFVYVKEGQKDLVKAAAMSPIQSLNTGCGGAFNFSIQNLDTNNHTFGGLATGAALLRQGIVKFSGIDYQTAQGNYENITEITLAGGVKENLGRIDGLVEYAKDNVLAFDPDQKILYELNTNTKTGVKIPVASYLNNKNVPNYMQNTTAFYPDYAIKDTQGKIHIYGLGLFNSTTDGLGRGFLGHLIQGEYGPDKFDVVALLDLAKPSSIGHLQFKKIAGQTGFESFVSDGVSTDLGVVFSAAINPDGTPITNSRFIFPDNGLGTFEVFIPSVHKRDMAGVQQQKEEGSRR